MPRKMDIEEKLIGLVEEHECLYNLQAKEYADKKSKYRAWVQISEEMKLSVAECNKKWKTLRDCFRKAVKVRQDMTNAGACKRPIKYEKQLRFLVPHLADRPHKRYSVAKDPDDSQNIDSNEQISRIRKYYAEGNNFDNPCDSFFLTMSGKVKQMPKRVQAEIERDVFRIINEAEIKLASDTVTAFKVQCSESCMANTRVAEVKEEEKEDSVQ